MDEPSEYHPDLTHERLREITTVVRRVRAEAFSDHSLRHDGAWTLGCMVHERAMRALEERAQEVDWLTFTPEAGLAYSLRVGAVPIRVQRDDVPTKRVLGGERAALETVQRAFDFGDGRPVETIVRLELGVHEGIVTQALLRVRERHLGTILHEWELPLGAVEEFDEVGFQATSENVATFPEAEREVLPPVSLDDDMTLSEVEAEDGSQSS